MTTVIKATLRTHEKMEFDASITLIEKVNCCLAGIFELQKGYESIDCADPRVPQGKHPQLILLHL
jgi:hypothetical protein